MSAVEMYADPEVYMEEVPCDYGFEFCTDPQTQDMNLCTTQCMTYLESVEDQSKVQTKKGSEKGQKEKCPLFSKCRKFMDQMHDKCHDIKKALAKCGMLKK